LNMDELRERMDAIDAEVIQLLNERAKHALEAGAAKRENGEPVYAPERERMVLDGVRERNPGPLPDAAVKSIYREVISAIRALQHPTQVAFLGPRDTFSHMAALKVFGTHCEFHPVATVNDVFTEVERGRVDYGLVPVETAMGGGVSDTLDCFVTSRLKIINELMLHIKQNLLSNSLLGEIIKVYSKAQVFAQCRNWLKANLPKAELVDASSTAEAARIAAETPGAAAIAGILAAETYDVRVLVSGIEDMPDNFTRFFVLGRHMAKPTGNDKTAIMCAIKDRPGALYNIITPLAESHMNLTRIESRPSQRKAWEYVFFIDLLGHADDPGRSTRCRNTAMS